MRHAVVLVLVAGCSAGSSVTYYKDVKPLVAQKCAGCHYDGGIAPFKLTDAADFAAVAEKVKVAVSSRIMPPWLAGPGCADYQGDRSLSDAQIQTLVGWLDAGRPLGDPADDHAPPATPQPKLSRVDATLRMPQPYVPQLRPDDYRCFLLDWPEAAPGYVTGFRANPGDPRVVHHVIAFYAAPADVPTYQKLDDADPLPGYSCFGGPGGPAARTRWLGAWAPGGEGSDYPAGTGLRIEPGSKIVLQVHYNTATQAPVPDATSLDFKLDAAVDKEAIIQPYTDYAWVTEKTMDIPAGQSDVMHSYEADPTAFLATASGGVLANATPTTVWTATLHMHTRGSRALTRIDHADGSEECMLDIPRWDFHWQGAYAFTQPKLLRPGDKVYLECHWDNSAAGQPWIDGAQAAPADLNWGEGTGDEMCLAAFYLTQ